MNTGFHGVMVSTLDFESSDPSSNLGGTLSYFCNDPIYKAIFRVAKMGSILIKYIHVCNFYYMLYT